MGKWVATSLTECLAEKTGLKLAECLAKKTRLKKSACLEVLKILAETVTRELDRTGKVVLPGVCKFKTRVKPAAVSEGFPVAALQKSLVRSWSPSLRRGSAPPSRGGKTMHPRQ